MRVVVVVAHAAKLRECYFNPYSLCILFAIYKSCSHVNCGVECDDNAILHTIVCPSPGGKSIKITKPSSPLRRRDASSRHRQHRQNRYHKNKHTTHRLSQPTCVHVVRGTACLEGCGALVAENDFPSHNCVRHLHSIINIQGLAIEQLKSTVAGMQFVNTIQINQCL